MNFPILILTNYIHRSPKYHPIQFEYLEDLNLIVLSTATEKKFRPVDLPHLSLFNTSSQSQ